MRSRESVLLRLFPLLVVFVALTACETPQGPYRGPYPGPRPHPGTARPAPNLPGPDPHAVPSTGKDPDPGPPEITESHPHLVFTADGHDYGLQEKGAKVAHTAVFYNTGRETLVIKKVNTHCGCAAALLSAKEIPPGGRGTLKVVLDTGSLSGKRVKTVEVITNDPVHPEAKYPISCVVIADVELDPLILVLRATRAAGEVTAHFDVVNLNPKLDLVVKELRTSNPQIRAELSPLPPEVKKRGYRVNLFFDEAFGTRNFVERATVFNNSKRDPKLTIEIIGSVREAVLVTPVNLYFPAMRPGQEISRRVYVYRTDNKPLELLGMEDPSGIFELEKKRVAPGKWEIMVTVAGEMPDDTVRGSLIFLTDEPKEPRITLPFELPPGERK